MNQRTCRESYGRTLPLVILLVAVAAVAVILLVQMMAGLSAIHPRHHSAARPATTQSTQPTTAATLPVEDLLDLGPDEAKKYPPAVPPATFLDLVRLHDPAYPATQPLDMNLPLEEAGRFIVKEPVYVDPRGDLWITRADSNPMAQVIADATDPSPELPRDPNRRIPHVHFTRERIVFAHLTYPHGLARLMLVYEENDGATFATNGSKRFEVPRKEPKSLSATAATNASADEIQKSNRRSRFDWSRAFSFNDQIFVPTRQGASVLTLKDGGLVESASPVLLPAPAAGDAPAKANLRRSRTQYVLDWQGIVAWVPPDGSQPGGRSAARYVNGAWTALGPDQGWPADIIYIAPLMDGSVLRIARDPEVTGDAANQAVGARGERPVQLSFATLGNAADEKNLQASIGALIDQLSDDSAEKREAAFKKLQQYGPSLWPILEKQMDAVPTEEARARMRELLRNKEEATLGSLSLLDGKLRVLSRLSDGGVLLYAGGGVTAPAPEGDPLEIIPAWLTIRPGRYVELLPDLLTKNLDPDRCRIYTFGGETVVSDDVNGPRRFTGNDLTPLLPRSQRAYSEFIGLDNGGRWLLRIPASAGIHQPATTGAINSPAESQTLSVTQPAAARAGADSQSTLIIDPFLPDATPRLPAWVLNEESAGWDEKDWPCVKDPMVTTPAAIEASGWRKFEKTDRMMTTAEEVPPIAAPPVAPSPAVPATSSTTQSVATTPATDSAIAASQPTTREGNPLSTEDGHGPLLMIDTRGNCYYDGHTELHIVRRNGQKVDWPLPERAVGAGDVHLVRASDGRLFLFNAPGRVVRLKPLRPTAEHPDLFKVEAVFSRNIPNAAHPTRIWLDPAGRIDIVYDGNKVAILFPSGHVPPAFAQIIPAGQLEAPEE